ncbi:MAG: hypothetical protein ACRDGM_04770, partial [bacterium]
RIAPDGALRVVADGFKELSGLALDHAGHLFAGATRRRDDQEKRGAMIFKIQLPEGPVSPAIAGGFTQPRDLAFDVLGALFFTAKELRAERESHEDDKEDREETRSSGKREPDGRDEDDREEVDEDEPNKSAKGVILKATFNPDGSLQTLKPFASGLGAPEGLAFDRDGQLYVAESKHGRVLRFQAPAPPVLELLPPFTRQHMVTVKGTAARNATLTILGGASPAIGLADAHTGAFAIEVSLLPNTEQTLLVYATGARGDGLTSAATEVTVTHDDVPPDTEISGPSGMLTSPMATFTFTGTDNLTPPAQLRYAHSLDGAAFTSFSTTTTLTMTNLASGSHTLQVKTQDLADNEDPTPAGQTFTVDALNIQMTVPSPGATVPAGSLLVRGTVQAGGAELGVSVNGFPAAVDGNSFAALVPVAPNTTTLIAQATTASGATASHAITIAVVATSTTTFALHASPHSGVAPLTVTFSLLEGAAANVDLDFDGDGTVDFSGASLESRTFTYTQPGFYIPTAAVIDSQGNRVTANAVVQVFDRTILDFLLQAKWTSMKDALRRGD